MQFTLVTGKCVLCREGTKQMLALLDDIIEGRATMENARPWRTSRQPLKGSLCGLGKTAPNPVFQQCQSISATSTSRTCGTSAAPRENCKA